MWITWIKYRCLETQSSFKIKNGAAKQWKLLLNAQMLLDLN